MIASGQEDEKRATQSSCGVAPIPEYGCSTVLENQCMLYNLSFRVSTALHKVGLLYYQAVLDIVKHRLT